MPSFIYRVMVVVVSVAIATVASSFVGWRAAILVYHGGPDRRHSLIAFVILVPARNDLAPSKLITERIFWYITVRESGLAVKLDYLITYYMGIRDVAKRDYKMSRRYKLIRAASSKE
jgi:hypothetical protein